VPAGQLPDREVAAGRVRSVIARLTADGTVTARADGSVHRLFPVAVTAAEGEAIRSRVITERAARTVEVGLGYGVSALHVCAGLLEAGNPAAQHVVIDPFQDTRFARCGLQVLDEAGVTAMVEHHAEESQAALPRMVGEGRRFDLAVVDGNHRFDALFVDLYYLGRLLGPGAVIFLDDYQLPGVARAAAFFLANLGWTLEEASSADERHHWAVLRTSSRPDTRPFAFFADF
jgi:predicted O-methyltransferase YrrM